MSDSESGDPGFCDIWTVGKRSSLEPPPKTFCASDAAVPIDASTLMPRTQMKQKFEELRERHLRIVEGSRRRREQTRERRRLRKEAKLGKRRSLPVLSEEEEGDKKWEELKPYIDINKHLTGPVSHGALGPKTELEHLVDEAVESGDFDRAQALSDRLANREFAVQISRAFDAKKFAEKKAEEVASEKAKRQKKLQWGFEAKQRWQMKGNM